MCLSSYNSRSSCRRTGLCYEGDLRNHNWGTHVRLVLAEGISPLQPWGPQHLQYYAVCPCHFHCLQSQLPVSCGEHTRFSPGPSHHINAAITALPATAVRLDWTCLEEVYVPLHQRPLSYAIDDALYQCLLSTANTTRSCALSLSCGLQHAGAWFNVVPLSPMGLHFQDKEFRSCLRHWLGVPLHSSSYPCPECEGIADVFWDHQVGCGGNGDRIACHSAVGMCFSVLLSLLAALAPTKEARGLAWTSSRPTDIFLPTWRHGRPAALDVHIISPLQQQTVAEAAFNPGHALDVGVRRKLTSHISECCSASVDFIPLVAENLGGLAKDTFSTVRLIDRALVQRASLPDPSTSTKHLFERLVIYSPVARQCLFLAPSCSLYPSLPLWTNLIF